MCFWTRSGLTAVSDPHSIPMSEIWVRLPLGMVCAASFDVILSARRKSFRASSADVIAVAISSGVTAGRTITKNARIHTEGQARGKLAYSAGESSTAAWDSIPTRTPGTGVRYAPRRVASREEPNRTEGRP